MKTQTTFLVIISSLILSVNLLFEESILVEKSHNVIATSTAFNSEIKSISNFPKSESQIARSDFESSENRISNRMAPAVSCQSITVSLGPSGSVTIAEDAVNNGSTGNGVLSFDTNITTFDCSDIGSPVNVILTVTDNDGSTNCNTATVTVVDNTNPNAICSSTTSMVQLDSSGNGSISVTDVDNGSNDTCGPVDLTFTGGGVDLTNNIALNKPTNQSSTGYGGAASRGVDGDTNGSWGNRSVTHTGGNNPAPDGRFWEVDLQGDFDISLIRIWNRTDCCSNRLNNFRITLYDNGANVGSQVFTTQPSPSLEITSLTGTADRIRVTQLNNTALSIAEFQVYATGGAVYVFDCSDVGIQTLTMVATDASGNTSSCAHNVNVVDSIDPTITCPSNRTAFVDDSISCEASSVVLGTPVTSDNCGIASVTNNAPASGNFPLGVTNVTWTVTDTSGNTRTCIQTVTVIDNVDPVITCPANIVVNSEPGSCFANVTYSLPIVSDCSPFTLTQIDTSGLTSGQNFPVGTTLIEYRALDDTNLLATCSFTITVIDNENPRLVIASNITGTTDSASCSASVTLPDAITLDNCGTTSLAWSITGDTNLSGVGQIGTENFNIGTAVITYTITDNAGNTNTDSLTVTITDNEDPTIICPANIIVTADSNCQVNTIALGAVSTSDNCGVSTVSNNATPPYAIGETEVTWTVTDNNGNTATCIQTITVIDNTAPSLTLDATVITVNTSSENDANCSIDVTITPVVFSDNCTINELSWEMIGATNNGTFGVGQVPSPYQFNVGTTTIEYTVTDSATPANSISKLLTINVLDDEAPTITSLPDFSVSNDPGVCGAFISWREPFATDNCSISSISQTAFSNPFTFPIGTTTVTYTAEDTSGNLTTESFDVTVTDDEGPTVTHPNQSTNLVTTTSSDGFGNCTTSTAIPDAVINDNCAISELTWVITGDTTDSGFNQVGTKTFNVGISVITYTVSDNNSPAIQTTLSITVEVTDDENPTLNLPSNITVNSCNTIVSYTLTGNDNCGVASISQIDTTGLTSGDAFPSGTTTLEYEIIDVNGQTFSDTFDITVIDDVLPIVNCPSNVTINNDVGLCTSNFDYQVIATDDCSASPALSWEMTGAETASGNDQIGNFSFPVGITIVTFTVSDGVNSDTCSSTVTVIDNESPVITCPIPLASYDTDLDSCTTSLSFTAIATDNCDASPILSYSIEGTLISFPYNFPIGTSVVDVLSNTTNGLTDNCSFNVVVEDNQDPIVSCPTVASSYSTDFGLCTATLSVFATTSDNNCSVTPIIGYTIAGASITFPYDFPTGSTVVTATANDGNGQTDTCQYRVIVEDNENPIANCIGSLDVILDASGIASITISDINNSSTDNCGIQNLALDVFNFDCDDLGANTVTLTVTDTSGNTSTCETIVNVLDPASIATVGINVDSNPICIDGDIEFTAIATNGGSTPIYEWFINGISQGTNSPNFEPFISINDGDEVYVQMQSSLSSCDTFVQSNSIFITLYPTPVLSAPAEICVGNSDNLTPNSGGTWSSSNTSIATVNNAGVINGVLAGTVEFIFTSATGGCAYATNLVTVNPLPVLTAPTTICIGLAENLAPSSGGTWSSNNVAVATINNTGTVIGIRTGFVTFTFMDSNGCANMTTSVEVLESPVIDAITAPTSPICSGETVTLQASVLPSSNPPNRETLINYNFNLGRDTGGYVDYDGQEIPGIVSDMLSSTMTYNYGYGGTNTGSNAFVPDPVSGNENSLRQLDDSGFDDDGEWIFNIGGSVLDDYRDYRVYFQTRRNNINGNPKYIDVSYRINGTGAFIDVLRYNMENNSTSTTWREVLFSLPPQADNANQLEIKLYINDGRNSNRRRPDIRIDNFQLQGAIGGDTVSYSWAADTGLAAGLPASASIPSTANGIIQVTPTVTTNYTLTVQNGDNGCSDSETVSVTVIQSPELFVTADYCPDDDPATTVDEREFVQLIATSTSDPNVTYEWQTDPIQTGNSIFVDIAEIYTVIATNSAGCSTVGSVSIAEELVIDGSFTNFDDTAFTFTSEQIYVPDLPNFNRELNPDGGLLGYSVSDSGDKVHSGFHGRDHTNNTDGPRNFMIINGDGNVDAWRQSGTPVLRNTDYYYSCWVMNVIGTNNQARMPELQFRINGDLVGFSIIPPARTGNGPEGDNWVRFYGIWNSGNATSVDIFIVNLNNSQPGNDYGLDDISFATLSTFVRLETDLPTISQIECQNNPIETIGYEIGGGLNPPTIEWTKNGTPLGTDVFPDGLSNTYNGSMYNISGTPVEFGLYQYILQTTSACDVKSAGGILEVLEAPAVIINNTIDPICFSESSVLMNASLYGTATSGSWSTNGTGTFTGVAGDGATATYNFGIGETSGMVTLSFTSNDPYGPCEPIVATYDLEITPYVVAEAGSVTAASDCADTTITLLANDVNGNWTVTSGQPSGSYFFSDTTAHNSDFTGESGELYTLQWEAINVALCDNTIDTVEVILPDCGRNIDFDGVDDFISFSNSYGMDSRAFSIEAWIKTDNTSGLKTIISKRNGNGLTTGYDLMLSNNRLRFRWNTSSGLLSNQALNSSRWYHVAVTFNGSNTYNLFIDGFNVGSSTSAVGPLPNANRFIIGAMDRTNSKPTNFFGGEIDEVRIWNVSLSQTQIREMMNQELAEDGTEVRGVILPQNISGLRWSDLMGYYQMAVGSQSSVLNGNINDISSAIPNSGKLNSMNSLQLETAPIPYVTTNNNTWDTPNTWLNGNVQQIPNSTSNSINGNAQTWNIVRTQNTISTNRATTVLGLLVDSSELSVIDDQPLTVNKYLRLDGKIDLEGESQLIQPMGSIVDAASTGNLERDQQGTSNLFNYNYWSSPVSDNGSDFSVGNVLYDGSNPSNPIAVNWTNSFNADGTSMPVTLSRRWLYTYTNSPANSYSNWALISETTPLDLGVGFTMKGSGSSYTSHNYTFIGKPNNGTITTMITPDGQVLLGNPYPSALDSFEFIADNETALGSGTLDFWEHASSNSSHLLSAYEGGYAVLSLSGGLAAATPPSEIGGLGNASKIPGRYIPIGQGFFVTGNATGGTVRFQNSQRFFRKESLSSVFLRTASNTDDSGAREDDLIKRLRIDFISPENSIRHLLLAFIENGEATDGVDFGYDAPNNDDFPSDMSFNIDGGNYVIQGVGPFDETKAYPLSITLATAGTIQIVFDELENFDEVIDLFIYDALLDTYTNFNGTNYQISLEAGDYVDRFFLTFQDNDSLSVADTERSDIVVSYLLNTNEIFIKTPSSINVKQIYLINLTGQTVGAWNSTNQPLSNEIRIPVQNVSEGGYILKVETNYRIYNKKIIVKY